MKESLVVFTEGARVNFKVYGYLVPIFAGLLDGEPQIFGVAWEDAAQKDAFALKVRDWIATDRLKEYIMVVEAWTANTSWRDQAKVLQWLETHGSLQNWPDRSEVVMVIYCSPTEEIQYTADIIRGRIPVPIIGEWKISHRQVKFNLEDFTTRFQGLFLKSKAGQN